MASFVFRSRMVVEFGHCDPVGIVLAKRIFEYFDIGTWALFEAALGVKRQDFATTFGILPLVDVRANCLKPVRFGDVFEIASRVAEFRRSSFDVEHQITLDGELAIEGAETRVWAARHKNDPEKISALAIPGEVIARFE